MFHRARPGNRGKRAGTEARATNSDARVRRREALRSLAGCCRFDEPDDVALGGSARSAGHAGVGDFVLDLRELNGPDLGLFALVEHFADVFSCDILVA